MPPTTVDFLDMLRNLDTSLLLDPVRRAQGSPSFEILDRTVEPISHEKYLFTTGGLFLFSGHGRDGSGAASWSMVMKIILDPHWEDLRSVFYWKREFLAFESGLLATLPDAVRAPRYYGETERDDGVWVWMEHLVDHAGKRWSLEHFQRAAHQFGRFGGAYLTGTPLPDTPWLSSPSFQSTIQDDSHMVRRMKLDSDMSIWQRPVVQRAFAEPLRSFILGIWAEKELFRDTMDVLPQVFCHKDLSRRNLMLCLTPDGSEEVVALDWAWCGNGALGLDMGWMVGGSLYLLDFDVTQAEELEATVLDAYLSGLRAAGWSGDERLIRLGYLIPLTFWMGMLPAWTAMMLGDELEADTVPMYGRSAPEVLDAWLAMAKFLTPRVDEARHLMRELNIP